MASDPFKKGNEPSAAAKWGNRILLGLFACVAGAMVTLIALSFIVPPMLQGVVDDYTDLEPNEFETAVLSEEAREDLDTRLNAFEEAINTGEPVEPMEIQDSELNGLIADDQNLNRKLMVQFRDGLLHANMSIPIDNDLELGPWRGEMRGRYLNGVAVLEPSINPNGLSVTLTDFVVKGESVPVWLHAVLQNEIDRLDWLHSDDVLATVSKLESIQIVGDRLVLHPKS